MFTQSMTKHVVSLVNEEGGGGCGWELFLSRFLNSCIIHMTRIMQAIEETTCFFLQERTVFYQRNYIACASEDITFKNLELE